MKKIDTIVVAPHFYTMEGAGVGYHGDAAMAAVSYTHLDVYKRQLWIRSSLPCWKSMWS